MANEFAGLTAHSAEYFGDTRDFWWHDDQLQAVARHWRTEEMRLVLDVGCGVGHWGRALSRALPVNTRVIGIDRESRWIDVATARATQAGLAPRFTYRVAAAQALPFDDGTFDAVTCQTLLMHVPDPARVLAEMVRVTRPGGLVIAAEGNNSGASLVDSIAIGDPAAVTAAIVHFQLVCQEGIRALGEGNHVVGEALPRLFSAAGLQDVDLRLNERAWSMVPPYTSAFERAQADEEHDNAAREIGVWDQETTRRYFLAGGGDPTAFDSGWNAAVALRQRISAGIHAGTFSRAGGGFFYLMWGRRPAATTGG